MTDRELLEFAAKAAGLRINFHPTASYQWNPLERDDDAHRLESVLRLDVKLGTGSVTVGSATERYSHGDDPAAVKRRAIVRAAAAIGKDLP